MNRKLPLSAAGLAAALCLAAGPSVAAESYDNCTGTISSLPAVISTQGTWCMKQDLATAIASGAAIQVNTNNVTIDCNYFKLGGLSAGAATTAYGVLASSRSNITVRNCNIRGFATGVWLTGVGHVVEDARFEGNTQRGIYVSGEANVVARNQVFDTGGGTSGSGTAIGIYLVGNADAMGNTVNGVASTTGSGQGAWGFYIADGTTPAESNVEGNRVRGVVKDGAGTSAAIRSQATGRTVVRGNALFGQGTGNGVQCANLNGVARDNSILGFGIGLSGCPDDGGNVVKALP